MKSYVERCPDGTSKTVYKKAENAFPLFIAGYEANAAAKIKSELLQAVELDGGLKSKVDGLLFGLDEMNNSIAMTFRSAYMGYQTDPCSNNQFLLDEITKIREEQAGLRTLKMQIAGYIELAKNSPDDLTNLAASYADLVQSMSSVVVDNSLIPKAMQNSQDAAQALTGDEK